MVLSLIVKARLMLEATWEPFLFWTPINADFQGELWFLNPLCQKKKKKKQKEKEKIFNVFVVVEMMVIQQYDSRMHNICTIHVQTLIRDGMESVTNSGQNTL